MSVSRYFRLVVLLFILAPALPATAAVNARDLPESSGPFDTLLIPKGTRELVQNGTAFAHSPIFPRPILEQLKRLVIDAEGSCPWTRLGPALRAALSNREMTFLAFVRDPRGLTKVLKLVADDLPSTRIFFPAAGLLNDEENIVAVDRDLKHGTLLEHQGAALAPVALVSVLDRVLASQGALYTLPGSRPTRANFPIWLAPHGYATWQDVVTAASVLEAAGFEKVLLQVP